MPHLEQTGVEQPITQNPAELDVSEDIFALLTTMSFQKCFQHVSDLPCVQVRLNDA